MARAPLKPVKSAASFTNIGGPEGSVLVPLLEAVVNGHSTLQKLSDRCALIKARMRVQTAVLSDVKITEDSWTDAMVKFPLACNEMFVERWAESVVRTQLKARASLPEAFFTELDRRVTQDLAAAEHAPRALPWVCFHSLNINASRCSCVF